MNHNAIRGLASIIIPCWNQLEFTRQCITALVRNTRRPWELIVIDNGSTDGTSAYLSGVQDAAAVPVTLISNRENRGFPAAINQGLQQARGEYLVLLNNDVVVTDAWLDQLTALTTAKTGGEQNGLTAEDAKSAKERKEGNGTGELWDETLIDLGQRPNVTVIDFEEGRSASEAQHPTLKISAVVPVELRTMDQGPRTDNPFDPAVADRSLTTPPGPPFTRGGKVGLAGPMSNYAAPPQLVENVPYHDLGEMHRFARTWRNEHRGQWFTVPKLSGFCLLMKRAVYDAIGGLDEQFGMGFFDDDDLAERARRAGFELAVAHDLFVHHFGSRTFAGNGVDAEKLLDENAGRFAAKWGMARTNGRRVALTPFTANPLKNGDEESRPQISQINADSGRRLRISDNRVNQNEPIIEMGRRSTPRIVPPARPASSHLRKSAKSADNDPPVRINPIAVAGDKATVTLTMIVRDEERNLPKCLESVRGLFDEIVVVDTGSTDRTVEIARSFGARVFDFVWVDDFAAARNAALARATGDYAFWLDADDVVEPGQRQKLETILKRLRKGEEAAYVVRCACDPGPDGSGGDTVVDHIRLFPIREGIRWTYRVHEQILPALRRARIPVHWTDLTVRHTGYVDQVLRSKKLDRDTRILIQELEARPDDPFTLFNLGAIAGERRDWNGALGFLQRSLAGSAPSDSIVRKLYALIARAHQMLGDSQGALQTCAEGLQLDPGDAELWFRKAVVHRHRGEPGDAEQCWRRVLHCKRPDQFCSLDQGIYGHLTRRNLAALAAERGDFAETERLWREVLAECPGDREAIGKLNGVRETRPAPADNPSNSRISPWIVPGSRRRTVPACGSDDFDPYAPAARAWVEALRATVIVELGVRFGRCTRALLKGAEAVDGHVWGVDALERHDVHDERFTFIQANALEVAGQWERIDLLHVDIDPQREDDLRRWLAEYAVRCRAIAVCNSHHPGFRLGPIIAALAATGRWEVYEYRGNLAGWTILVRPGESVPAGDEVVDGETGAGPSAVE